MQYVLRGGCVGSRFRRGDPLTCPSNKACVLVKIVRTKNVLKKKTRDLLEKDICLCTAAVPICCVE